MATAKARAKRHKHVKKTGWEAHVPAFNVMDYKGSMLRTLNYFNGEVEDKTKKSITIKYWKSQRLDVEGLDKLPDYEYTQAGVLAWLLKNETELEPRDLQRLDTKYIDLKSKVVVEKKVDAPKRPSVQDHLEKIANTHTAEFDAAIDEHCMYATSEFDAAAYLKSNNVTSPVAKKIADKLVSYVDEAKAALNKDDEQLVEGYSLFTRPHLKKYVAFIESMIDACNTLAKQVRASVVRKPRKRKEKPATVLVARMKYKGQDDDYKIVSVDPAKIVGASEAWIFNTRYRKMFRYVADEGSTLTVRGATIKNFNVEMSGGKVVRKPEKFFADIATGGKRQANKMFDALKSVMGRATGRMNEDCLIYRVY